MARPASRKPTTVLIVEDQAIVRAELTAQLVDMGLIAFSASDADEAIVLLAAHPEIKLLLTDIRMPGSMDGLRLAHYVRHRWPPVRIIVISGMIGTALSQLPDDSIFLAKPYEPAGLSEALGYMIGGDAPQTEGPPARARA